MKLKRKKIEVVEEQPKVKKKRVYKNTENMGRPNVETRQKHQRIALYPESYEIFKRLADQDGEYMIVWLDKLAKKLDK
jgi:hypothetical protein